VKISYFPNWQVSGAQGPYRVTPNLMVVVPTSTHVELTYGRTWVEYVSYTATLLGIAGLVLLARRGAYRFRARAPRPAGAAAGRSPWAAFADRVLRPDHARDALVPSGDAVEGAGAQEPDGLDESGELDRPDPPELPDPPDLPDERPPPSADPER
jgi:hypothetical protein